MIDRSLFSSYSYPMKNSQRLYGIRGAVCVSDTEEDMQEKVSTLYETILSKNNLSEDDIVSIQFTLTKDITSANPAAVLRKASWASDVPLFCSLEPDIIGSLPFVVRILITAYLDKKPIPVYLHGAEVLRRDLIQ